LLLVTDNAGMTTLYDAACEGYLDVLLEIQEWAEGN
jgi:hypothetical protein